MVEKLVHVPGDVFIGITAGQLDRAASMLEEVADALRKVEEIVKEGEK